MRTNRGMSPWSTTRPPGSRTKSVCTCQGLRPRRVVGELAIARPFVWPSAYGTASAPGLSLFPRLNDWPAHSPVNASRTASRPPAHDSGPMWIATPLSQLTCTIYSLPVSRRTPFPALGAEHLRLVLEFLIDEPIEECRVGQIALVVRLAPITKDVSAGGNVGDDADK